jgi:hypothetical protein
MPPVGLLRDVEDRKGNSRRENYSDESRRLCAGLDGQSWPGPEASASRDQSHTCCGPWRPFRHSGLNSSASSKASTRPRRRGRWFHGARRRGGARAQPDCRAGSCGAPKRQSEGKRLGRPRVVVDAAKIAALRASGASWRIVCEKTGLTKGTAQRGLRSLHKNLALPKKIISAHVETR